MFYPREVVQELEQLEVSEWSGMVYRHMLGEHSPELANWRGARWNPFEVNAIYVSLAREAALAEVISLGLVQADQRVSCSQERLQTHSAERSR